MNPSDKPIQKMYNRTIKILNTHEFRKKKKDNTS